MITVVGLIMRKIINMENNSQKYPNTTKAKSSAPGCQKEKGTGDEVVKLEQHAQRRMTIHHLPISTLFH